MGLNELDAVQAAALLQSGQISAEELTRDCLAQIEVREPAVQAWAFLDPDYALKQARAADAARRSGRALGPLHGLPVGIKDNIDTRDMPTEDGTVLHAGRRPAEDATAVALLRAAGAVILGKTVTTELAVYSPGPTRNPHNPAHTPGGSSSGSAAAVAAFMVPLALGSQTNGSLIRPASYCGVYGYKPTHGWISRHRVLQQSRPLDHLGVFARCVEDLALLTEPLLAYDAHDPDMRPQARPSLCSVAAQEPPVTPRLAVVRTPFWEEHAEPATRAAFAELVAYLGAAIEEVELPAAFGQVLRWQATLMEADLARSFAPDYARGRAQLSERLCAMIERGQQVTAVDYLDAAAQRITLNALLEPLFARYDALLTPASTGAAPLGLSATGNPVFCTPWTFCGTPAVCLPLLQDDAGLPIGVQLVAACGDDARLLRSARWLAGRMMTTE